MARLASAWPDDRVTTGGEEPELVVLADPEAVWQAAAERLAGALANAVAARGRADWATTGGTSSPGIYGRLARPPLRDEVPWDDVQLWWGDDRYVPRDHPASNVQPVDQILMAAAALSGESGSGDSGVDVESGVLPGAPLPPANVHPFPTTEAIGNGGGAEWCAQRYAAELHAADLTVRNFMPVFDVLLVGVGPDGHVLSVFPDSAAFDSDSWALEVPAPTHVEPHIERVTLNPRVVEVARLVLVVVTGRTKADAIGAVFGPERDPRRWPAQLARRPGAVWFLDGDAATAVSR